MPVLHLFNPGHDEALVFTRACTTGSRAARLLENELSLLPIWWAEDGDYILLPMGGEAFPEKECAVDMGNGEVGKGKNICRYRMETEERNADYAAFSLEIVFSGNVERTVRYTLVRPKKGRQIPAGFWEMVERVEAWGMDLAMRALLSRLGAPARLLPPVSWVNEVVRPLSSRATAVRLLPLLRRGLPETEGRSCWCTTCEEVETAVRKYGPSLCKVAWSCSGRGVFPVSFPLDEGVTMRICKSLDRCGGIAVEPFYDRVCDFAMEFVVTEKEVRFEGMSVFLTSGPGRYGGNVVASDDRLVSMLPGEIRRLLPRVRDVLALHLSPLLVGHYAGPLGVDMMAVRLPDGKLALHPCVELNLRRTMGFVALHLRKLLSGEGESRLFAIRPVDTVSSGMCCLTPFSRVMTAVWEGIQS